MKSKSRKRRLPMNEKRLNEKKLLDELTAMKNITIGYWKRGMESLGISESEDSEWKKNIELVEQACEQIRNLIQTSKPSDMQIERWCLENWDPNWSESRCFEDDLNWLRKFVNDLVVGG